MIIENEIDKIERYNALCPLFQAIEKHKYNKLENLIGEYDINREWPPHSNTALLYAIEKNDLHSVQILVENGADVNLDGIRGLPLNQAIFKGNTAIMTYLLENGADVSRSSGMLYAMSPIQYATQTMAGIDVFEVLLKFGADINASSEKNDTPLQIVILSGNYILARFLLENGANPSLIGDREKYLLKMHPIDKMTDLLLEYGVDTTLNKESYSPLDILLEYGADTTLLH
ncbi:MAG: ankyrin repeat domain-containing protein [Tannerella sp.]|nr:ankyrin repeat domain-containing protein [Tannerella sp.]